MKAGVCIGQLSDRGNEACLVRTAEAFGVPQVHIVDNAKRSIESSIARGAEKHVSVYHHDSYSDLVRRARANNQSIVGIEHSDESVGLTEVEHWPTNPIFVTGNEVHGIPKAISRSADCIVHIEQAATGYMRCLNTSVAGSIVMQNWFADRMTNDATQSEFVERPTLENNTTKSTRHSEAMPFKHLAEALED